MEDGGRWISEDQDDTSFGKEIFLLNFLYLGHRLWMDFGPDGQHGVEEEAPEDHQPEGKLSRPGRTSNQLQSHQEQFQL